MFERSSGILLHPTSLPGKYGIGTLGKEAFAFVDFLKKSNQKLWQIFPLGPTGYGDSPYQSFSTFAGNPYLIDFDLLIEENLLSQSDLEGISFGENPESVDSVSGKWHWPPLPNQAPAPAFRSNHRRGESLPLQR